MRLLTTTLCLTGLTVSAKNIFESKQSATQQLHYRAKRDNNGIFEEVRAADLQRECVDEVCSYDEVLEAYNQDEAQAQAWWDNATKMCEKEGSCNRDGTQTCVNKWMSRECQCKSGWQNLVSDDCSEDIDECANADWCANDAVCENSIGSFTCHCTEGWEGPQCQQDINECEAAVNPCQNDGICTNTEGSFTCECTPQWTGDRCEIDVNECAAEVDPCQNDSSCINTQGSYQCLCNNGWGGQNCDTDFDECGNGLCPKGTVCQALEMNQFTCVCPERGCNNLDEEEYQNLLAQVSLPEEDSSDYADQSAEETSSYDSYDDNAYESVNSTNYDSVAEDDNSNSDYEYQTIDEEDNSELDSEAYENVIDSDVEENNSYDIYGEEVAAEENVYGEEVAADDSEDAYGAYEQSVDESSYY